VTVGAAHTSAPGAGVRRASAADVPALAEMLARAFEDDPVAEWVSPLAGTRLAMLERFHAARLRHMLPHGEVWMTVGGEAAAVWAPPETGKTTVRHELELTRSVLAPRLLPRLPMVQRGMNRMEKAHPHEPPHYYLAVLGTNPAAQGRGLGTKVLEPVLAQCDRDGIGAYLESSKERNVDYYARFGFRTTRTLHLPKGPDVWLMWREPAR
jgi:ribosomal protein S18 acetylase RimI-like enzyme